MHSKLTSSEIKLISSLPKPSATIEVQTTNIWIIEWLSTGERRTGKELHDWMEQQRPEWSHYNQCTTKRDVIRSIKKAAYSAQQNSLIPILHIEAHGGLTGISPSSDSQGEALKWEELTTPLQELNVATNCNLIIVISACLGFTAIKALTQGPRAPAIAIIGTDATICEGDLLLGTKELYRRYTDKKPRLVDIIESASQEMCDGNFEMESFTLLAYEAAVEQLVRRARPRSRKARIERLRLRISKETGFSAEEIESHLGCLSKTPLSNDLQKIWDHMFMIDLDPNNENRFGLNWSEIEEQINNWN